MFAQEASIIVSQKRGGGKRILDYFLRGARRALVGEPTANTYRKKCNFAANQRQTQEKTGGREAKK